MLLKKLGLQYCRNSDALILYFSLFLILKYPTSLTKLLYIERHN